MKRRMISFVVALTILFGGVAQAQSTNAVPSSMPGGHIDKVKDTIGLWTLDSDRPNSTTGVVVWEDGVEDPVVNQPTFHVRPDVNAAFNVSGNHGLTVSTPAMTCPDSRVRRFYAYAVDEETGDLAHLGGSPKSYLCWDNPVAPNFTALVLGNGFWPLDSARTSGLDVNLHKKSSNGTYS